VVFLKKMNPNGARAARKLLWSRRVLYTNIVLTCFAWSFITHELRRERATGYFLYELPWWKLRDRFVGGTSLIVGVRFELMIMHYRKGRRLFFSFLWRRKETEPDDLRNSVSALSDRMFFLVCECFFFDFFFFCFF
jgi:hypothetical protein